MTSQPQSGMPTVPFGPHTISRLIVGANPINGGSHLSRFVNVAMKSYFTPERVLAMLRQCEDVGISTWQSAPHNVELYRQHREAGGKLHYISLAADREDDPDQLQRILDVGTIAVAHHGEVTDSLFKKGKIDKVRNYLRRVRDAGVMVGVSTHMPAVIDHIESAGWDVDFYMCCAYERHRTREKLKALLGYVPIPIREVYLEEDPSRMFAAMRSTDKPCLAFKILAAGRLCDRQETVEQAFRQTFEQIKPTDAVIVGMWPEHEDQVAINAGYTREFSGLSAGG